MAVLTSLTRFPSSSSSSSFLSSNARHLFLSPSSPSFSIKQRFNLFSFKPSRSLASMSSSSSSSPPLQEKITAPYGSWKSPITADIVSGASKRLGGTAVDSRGRLVWLESRPNESGYLIFLPTLISIRLETNWIDLNVEGEGFWWWKEKRDQLISHQKSWQ